MQVGPCIPVGMQLETAEVGPTSGPTWHLSHCEARAEALNPADGLRGRGPWSSGVAAGAGRETRLGREAEPGRRARHAAPGPPGRAAGGRAAPKLPAPGLGGAAGRPGAAGLRRAAGPEGAGETGLHGGEEGGAGAGGGRGGGGRLRGRRELPRAALLQGGRYARRAGEKDAELAQKFCQLQPFLAAFPQECMGQLAYFTFLFGPTLHLYRCSAPSTTPTTTR